MSVEGIENDIAVIRRLAEEGRTGPLLSGVYLIIWGALTAFAFVGHYAILNVAPPEDRWLLAAMWSGYSIIGAAATILIHRRNSSRAVASSHRAESLIWTAGQIILAVVATAAIVRMFINSEWTAPNIIPGIAFAVYAGCLASSSRLVDDTVTTRFGWLSGVFAFGLLIVQDRPEMYLVASAGCVLCLLAPGVLMEMRSRSRVTPE
jgi:hypothetical protein